MRCKLTCLWDSSRCFMSTATTTLTSTNCAIRTNTTKKSGATYWLTQQFLRHSSDSSHSSLSVSFMIPFQLSPAYSYSSQTMDTVKQNWPVAILNSVRKAIPKDLKCACSPKPWQGYSSSHSKKENINGYHNHMNTCLGRLSTILHICTMESVENK